GPGRYILRRSGGGACFSVALQSTRVLSLSDGPDRTIVRRRALFSGLVLGTMAALLGLAALALSAGGFGAVDALLLVLFAITLPCSLVGFWNAAIGFIIMRFARDPVRLVLEGIRLPQANE